MKYAAVGYSPIYTGVCHMYSPHVVTLIYTREVANGCVQQDVTILKGVFLDTHEGGILTKTGIQNSDNATLFIPQSVRAVDGYSHEKKKYIEPQYYETVDASDYWTLETAGKNSGMDCFFVLGVPDLSGPLDYQTLRKTNPHCYRVTTVDFRNFGGPKMRHWQVGGK